MIKKRKKIFRKMFIVTDLVSLTTTKSKAKVWYHENTFKPAPPLPVAYAAGCSKAAVLLLSIHCISLLPFFCGGTVFGPCFVIQYFISF